MDRHALSALASLDGLLLHDLKVLLELRSVTGAARALDRSQPSVSRTLQRLRTVFGDPLLVPAGRRLEPTPRARSLGPLVDRALESLAQVLAPPRPFSPADERRTVRIAASDYAVVVLLHPWLARLRREAPGVVVEVSPIDADRIEPLARGDLDLALAPRLPAAGLDQFVYREVLGDRMVCVLRRDHPRARARLTLPGYLALQHIMVASVLPPVSAIDAALHRLEKTRTVAARVPSVVAALMLARDTDLAAACYARIVPSVSGLVAKPLPFPTPPLVLHLMWHPRSTLDPFHRWVRDGIAALAPRASR